MTNHRVLQAAGLLTGIALFLLLTARFTVEAAAVRNGIALGIALSWLNGILGFSSLYWAIRRTDQMFFKVWGSGILFRLLVLAGTAYFVIGDARFDTLSTLLPLVFVTMIFQFLEFEFLPKKAGYGL